MYSKPLPLNPEIQEGNLTSLASPHLQVSFMLHHQHLLPYLPNRYAPTRRVATRGKHLVAMYAGCGLHLVVNPWCMHEGYSSCLCVCVCAHARITTLAAAYLVYLLKISVIKFLMAFSSHALYEFR